MSGVSGIINGIRNTNDVREGALAPSDGSSGSSCTVFETGAHGIAGHSIMLDLLRKQLVCLEASLENKLNTLNSNRII